MLNSHSCVPIPDEAEFLHELPARRDGENEQSRLVNGAQSEAYYLWVHILS